MPTTDELAAALQALRDRVVVLENQMDKVKLRLLKGRPQDRIPEPPE